MNLQSNSTNWHCINIKVNINKSKSKHEYFRKGSWFDNNLGECFYGKFLCNRSKIWLNCWIHDYSLWYDLAFVHMMDNRKNSVTLLLILWMHNHVRSMFEVLLYSNWPDSQKLSWYDVHAVQNNNHHNAKWCIFSQHIRFYSISSRKLSTDACVYIVLQFTKHSCNCVAMFDTKRKRKKKKHQKAYVFN